MIGSQQALLEATSLVPHSLSHFPKVSLLPHRLVASSPPFTKKSALTLVLHLGPPRRLPVEAIFSCSNHTGSGDFNSEPLKIAALLEAWDRGSAGLLSLHCALLPGYGFFSLVFIILIIIERCSRLRGLKSPTHYYFYDALQTDVNVHIYRNTLLAAVVLPHIF